MDTYTKIFEFSCFEFIELDEELFYVYIIIYMICVILYTGKYFTYNLVAHVILKKRYR